MAHYHHREEESWERFTFEFPYAEGLRRLREEVLEKTDFDPAVLWVWGTMQARAVIEVLKACEREFGEEGQRVVREALVEVGREVGRQMMGELEPPEGLSEAEMASFFATVVNCIAYASLEEPSIDSEDEVSFHILWCPHQDVYSAFDCRVQRYFVQGMLEAVREKGMLEGWQVRFTQTIPAGADTCRFVLWRAPGGERSRWEEYSEELERKALELAEEAERG
ncbi:MAG: L-2-amino-thiazoline-4-carboxylic acid hydrolase [Actinobacteria bacterium]|nr:L-2-amino-thiazoline-4-carboxylic acid hydrolase [Actinomycetota bacterium]MDI6830853.1 L-2-amino-thiazoline-4-carboxylic acid hydrolase [Actinomycetota bacterium]